jgi:hypothetical protein
MPYCLYIRKKYSTTGVHQPQPPLLWMSGIFYCVSEVKSFHGYSHAVRLGMTLKYPSGEHG